MVTNHPIVVVVIECPLDQAAEFDQWYKDVHIPMALRYKGMIKATRYRVPLSSYERNRYLTIFEFDDKEAMKAFPSSPEVAAAKAEMGQRWTAKPPFTIVSRTECEPLST